MKDRIINTVKMLNVSIGKDRVRTDSGSILTQYHAGIVGIAVLRLMKLEMDPRSRAYNVALDLSPWITLTTGITLEY